jgi:hypothetical protein
LDPSSFGNIDVIQTRHIQLDVTVNLDQQVLFGNNTLTMQAIGLRSNCSLNRRRLHNMARCIVISTGTKACPLRKRRAGYLTLSGALKSRLLSNDRT